MARSIQVLGDRALVVALGERIDHETFDRVHTLSQVICRSPLPGVVELVPAYTTLTIYYDPLRTSFEALRQEIQDLLADLPTSPTLASRTIEIPVCYGRAFGVDIAHVAQHNRLTIAEVIAIHSAGNYLVHMLGFTPGFPYLGGMSEKISTPRQETPRLKVPAGSVGIAGVQTGIYPTESPGGWQIIGRTPMALFTPQDDPPTLLAPGDTVRFRPITEVEFASLAEGAR